MKLEFPPGDTHFKPEDWDNYQLLAYRELVKHSCSGIALDCGAHAGIMTRRMAEDYASVVAFEPVHDQLLQRNTQDLDNVRIIGKALSDRVGKSVMCINSENTGDNRLGSGDRPVTTVTIDSFNFTGVAAIKMDLQGAELSALMGAATTITGDHPTLMIEVERNDPNAGAIHLLLTGWGYAQVFAKNADRIYAWRG